MDPDPSILLIGIALCLALLAFASAVEASLTAISRHRLNLLQEEDASRAAAVARLLEDPYRFKVAIRLIDLVAIMSATGLTLVAARALPPAWQLGALGLLLLLILIFGEALPRALALVNISDTARALAGPMALGAALIWPLAATVGWLTRPLVRLVSGRDTTQHPLVTEEELRMLVNVGEEEGLIEPDEREMIEGIFSFGDMLVREVMVPRVDIVALDSDSTIDEALAVVMQNGHSRIPVYRETVDRVVGILYAKDLLPYLHSGRDLQLSAILRSPHFIPETMKVDALLKDLKSRRVHMALVVDEYGGTAGLVTIEDLLEQIVGDIQDEYDVEEPEVQRVADDELLVDARVLLDDLSELTGLELDSDESDTIGGLLYERLGRVPLVGDEIALEPGASLAVVSVEGLRPRRLRLRYTPSAEDEPEQRGEPDDAERRPAQRTA